MATRKKTEVKDTTSADQPVIIDQNNVSLLASKALARMQNSRVQLALRLVSVTPMLMQRWTTKAITQMLLPQVTGTKAPREPKDLTRAFEDSWYRNKNGAPVVPCRMAKAAIVSGAISTGKSVSKAELRRQLRVIGETSPLLFSEDGEKYTAYPLDENGQPPRDESMDVAITRNTSGAPDVRARARFDSWAIEIVLEFAPAMLAVDKVMAAVRAAGDSIGLGEWRPENGGELGQFTVEVLTGANECARVLKACSIPEEPFVIPPELLRALSADSPKDGQRKVSSLSDEHKRQESRANGTLEDGAEAEEEED